MFASATYFITKQSVSFDSQGELSKLSAERLVTMLASEHDLPTDELNIVAFVSPDCHCNRVTATHKRNLQRFAKENDVSYRTVEVESSEVITATPSVLVTDKDGGLVYFGPVGEGIGCNENTDVVQTAVSNYQKGFNPNFVNDQAKGCYCSV